MYKQKIPWYYLVVKNRHWWLLAPLDKLLEATIGITIGFKFKMLLEPFSNGLHNF